MVVRTTVSDRSGWLAGLAVAAILAVTLLAVASLGTYAIAGSELTGMKGWPQPMGWIAQVLVIESWPTFRSVEIRWLAWALGAVGLVGLAAVTKHRQDNSTTAVTGPVLAILAGTGGLLTGLAAVRAVLATVPIVGLTWTWQLALSLLWMVALYVWTVRLPVQTLARAIAISLSVLSAISLLYCIQGHQPYPNWPTGNVLLLTTLCLAGVFLLGTWTYTLWTAAQRTGEVRDYVPAVAAAALLALVAVVLSMSGRRAGVLGLAAGGAFLAILTLLRRADLKTAVDPQAVYRVKMAILAAVLATLAAGAIVVPRLLTGGRWQTVQYRVEMYRAAGQVFRDKPAAALVGVGPAHLGFDLTALMRPLHAKSPRLFHGEITDQVHSEPLQAIAELGLPVGLLYLALPLGGLLGFAHAYRRTPDPSRRLAILGAGAALAAAMAAEATSVGMRNPDVAILAWTLAGIGWACGAQAGGFERLTRWLQPASNALSRLPGQTIWGATGVATSLVLTVIAWQSVRASADLYQAKHAWDAGRYGEAAVLLGKRPCVPTSGAWMSWKYVEGRTYLVLMSQAQDEKTALAWQAKGLSALGTLVSACPAYQNAPVWLGKAAGNWDEARAICEQFTQYDPYEYEARLLQAHLPGTTAPQQLTALRLAIRNAPVTGAYVARLLEVAQDPAAQPLLDDWMATARQALQEPEPGKWSDPLALESLRIAVVLAAQQARFPEALDRSNQAATLLKYLAGDPWQTRPEAVEMEVYLDQAWFGWLVRPEATRNCLGVLEGHLRELVRGPANAFSEKMAAQFLGMLWLSIGHEPEARHALYVGSPGSSWPMLDRLSGMACARLTALMGSQVPPEQLQMWARHGRRVLGDDLWKKMVEAWAPHRAAPWWHGLLSE